MRIISLCAAALFALAACKGADGAAGPQGPTGPAGPPGAEGPIGPAGLTVRFTASGVLSGAGGADRVLPTMPPDGTLPVVTCYITSEPVATAKVWLIVSDGNLDSAPYCGIVHNTSTGNWEVRFRQGIPGWSYYMVVMW
jgi:hypothetical protein